MTLLLVLAFQIVNRAHSSPIDNSTNSEGAISDLQRESDNLLWIRFEETDYYRGYLRRKYDSKFIMTPPKENHYNAIDQDSTWGHSGPVFCKNNSFAYAFRPRRSKGIFDDKGLMQLTLYCEDLAGGTANYIESGDKSNDKSWKMDKIDCPLAQGEPRFFIGVKGYWGGPSIGLGAIYPICDVADPTKWEYEFKDLKKPSQRTLWIGDNIDKHTYYGEFGLRYTFKCPKGQGICGIDSRAEINGLFTLNRWVSDESGINEIKIFCCVFPVIARPKVNRVYNRE